MAIPMAEVSARGPRLYLRPLRVVDVNSAYLRWMSDLEVTRFLESRFKTWTHDALAAFVAADEKAKTACSLAVCINETDQHIGNIRISKYDAPHCNGSVGLLIGEAGCRGKGYGTEAIALMCRYAFETLPVHRMTAGCYETNVASIAAFRKVGFREEGRQAERWVDGDSRVDGVTLGMTRSQWASQQDRIQRLMKGRL